MSRANHPKQCASQALARAILGIERARREILYDPRGPHVPHQSKLLQQVNEDLRTVDIHLRAR